MYQIPTTSKKEKRLLTVTFFVTFASFVILFFKLLDNIVTLLNVNWRTGKGCLI